MDYRSTGQIAFEAYVRTVGGKDVRGGAIPAWGELSDAVRQGWESAADAVKNFVVPVDWIEQLDDRQRKELNFATTYAIHFNHGTDGHHRLMLINKLRDLLEFRRRITAKGVAA